MDEETAEPSPMETDKAYRTAVQKLARVLVGIATAPRWELRVPQAWQVQGRIEHAEAFRPGDHPYNEFQADIAAECERQVKGGEIED